ncbi:MAG: protein O-mannosyl-transferase [Phycisphaerales bacterium]|jgi:hypothetical protein|nr:protein O-mannosyl-transferase [Phycisphaerales bacterium]
MSVRASRFLQIGLLVAAALAATYPVVDNRFINWDDRDQITQNPDFNPPRVGRMIEYWRGPYVGSLYPVSYNLFGLLAWIGGDPPAQIGEPVDPRAFHAASIVLHALATILIWLIVRELVEKDWPATIGALLFAVHPVQIEAVAWVSGMNTLLVAVLSFLAIWLYLRALKRERRAARFALLAAATLFYVLALWAKPAAVIVPIMAGLLDYLATRRRLRDIGIPVIVGIAIALPVMLITRKLQSVELVTPTPLWSRPIVALDAVAFYLYKLVVPARLLVDYGRTPQWLIDRPMVWATALVTIAVTIGCWAARRRWPWVWVSFAVFVAALLPVLGLTPFNVQMISTVTDRYLYLAMIGPALLVAFLLRDARGRSLYVAAAIVLVVLTVRSNLRSRDWHDEFTLFEPELRVNPRSLAGHQVLGATYAARQEFELAAGHLQAALAIKPDDSRSLFNLGNILLRFGRYDEAIARYRAALEKFPNHPRIHNNLGVALAQRGELDAAEAEFRRALELQRHMPEAVQGLQGVAKLRAAGVTGSANGGNSTPRARPSP